MSKEFFGMDPDQFLYMAEAEGKTDMVDTREAKINAIFNKVIEFRIDNSEVDVMEVIDEIIESEGIDVGDLTRSEKQIIDEAIIKKI